MSDYAENLRKHQQAEADLIRLQQQQAAMNAGTWQPEQQQPPQQQYQEPPQQQYQQPPPQQQQRELRGVFMEIIEARNLKDVEVIGDIDPYTLVIYGDQKVKTRAHKDAGVNPQLGDTLEVAITQGSDELLIELWDSNKYNVLTGDTFIGRARVNISDLRREELLDRWVALNDDDNGAAGEVHIKFHVNATTDPM
ncbi:hypothetical protein AMAG_16449 [Allomyces macrogynus ATCC 38327]|uniref:C2 domain-containing protein n=1 Tax=Allomyces macrogynus (strain ATCC 38327) TaxID=578462 RepID=A0A0L0TDD7_ALLM3|nr:hypothetical protein AMAG_16449 [Allomyces macrogynus ATCC 38327]|eukprot:KNE72691.1 hypothetical protein AMAG_16449 [Allomyces macrogynus ATCC 38327]